MLKTHILFLFWYHATVSPPPHSVITQLQTLANQFIWKGRNYHPKIDISSLPLRNGGINLPIIKVEIEIRLAKTISQAFAPHTPFWIHVFNHANSHNTQRHNPVHLSKTQHPTPIRTPPQQSFSLQKD